MPRTRNARGFAGMDPDHQREIASEGGRASHASGRGYEWDSDEAAEAGHLGGLAAHHHEQAAFHHDTAGFHHRQAARHYQNGNARGATFHADAGERHGRYAGEHASEARRHGRGFAWMDPDRQPDFGMGGRASRGDRGYYEYEEEGDGRRGSSRRGFAAMDPERPREIASEGGRDSRGGRGADMAYDEEETEVRRGSSRRGFAAMDPERQREIAAEGGRASHGGH